MRQTLDDVRAEVEAKNADQVQQAAKDAWSEEAWSEPSPENESPAPFDQGELIDKLHEERPTPKAASALAPREDPEPAVSIADAIYETQAPAVGLLTVPASGEASLLDEVGGVGLYMRPDRTMARCVVIGVERETNGRYVAIVRARPGQRWASQAETYQPAHGADEAAAAKWLSGFALSMRSQWLPLVITLGEGVLDGQAEQIAREAHAVVVAVKHEPGIATWEAHAIEAAPAEESVEAPRPRLREPEPPLPDALPERAVVAGVGTLSDRGFPEWIDVAGHRVDVAYHGEEFVMLRGFVEDQGHLRELEVITRDGQRRPISDGHWRLS